MRVSYCVAPEVQTVLKSSALVSKCHEFVAQIIDPKKYSASNDISEQIIDMQKLDEQIHKDKTREQTAAGDADVPCESVYQRTRLNTHLERK